MIIFLKVISWLGSGITLSGAVIAFRESWIIYSEHGKIGVAMGYLPAVWLGILGILLMLVGGLLSSPRFFWIACIAIGLLYIVSFFAIYAWDESFPNMTDLSISVLPGLVAFGEGVWLKFHPKL